MFALCLIYYPDRGAGKKLDIVVSPLLGLGFLDLPTSGYLGMRLQTSFKLFKPPQRGNFRKLQSQFSMGPCTPQATLLSWRSSKSVDLEAPVGVNVSVLGRGLVQKCGGFMPELPPQPAKIPTAGSTAAK